jgi:hypothetical protein
VHTHDSSASLSCQSNLFTGLTADAVIFVIFNLKNNIKQSENSRAKLGTDQFKK